MKPHEVLQSVFGFSSFRGQQEAVIKDVLNDRDALVIMPTGGGKSLCYQLPALIKEGLTIVISPLIALMNDQVASLQLLDIEAACLHSNLNPLETQTIYEKLDKGLLKLLYVSPEKLLSNGFLLYLSQQKISLFAIDEAHCVSVWGNDFRPEYVKLRVIKDKFPKTPVIALTATADQATQKDIEEQLGLQIEKSFISSFERHNIFLEVRPGQKRMDQIVQYVGQRKGQSGIIYCLSRKSTEKVATKLQSMGWRALAYHAGMDSQDRRRTETMFQRDEVDVICATIAFGMGIDKPDIRYIIHYNMPKNIEGYYQEIGRAGRDGAPSEALLFASWGDRLNLQKFIDDSQANEVFKSIQTEKLERMWQFANDDHCRTNFILNYFGEYRSVGCGHCDNCQNPPEYFDGTVATQMALSAVIRASEECNLQSLMEILKGSYSPEVKRHDWHQLKTFGVGRKSSMNEWRHYLIQIINQGYLSVDYSDRSRLKTTPLSRDVLKGKKSVNLSVFAPVKKKKTPPKIFVDDADIDESIMAKLRQWRTALSEKLSVPPYVILHDKSLKQIAGQKPKAVHELLTIDGIGEKKMEKYGQDIIDIIQNHSTQ